ERSKRTALLRQSAVVHELERDAKSLVRECLDLENERDETERVEPRSGTHQHLVRTRLDPHLRLEILVRTRDRFVHHAQDTVVRRWQRRHPSFPMERVSRRYIPITVRPKGKRTRRPAKRSTCSTPRI